MGFLHFMGIWLRFSPNGLVKVTFLQIPQIVSSKKKVKDGFFLLYGKTSRFSPKRTPKSNFSLESPNSELVPTKR